MPAPALAFAPWLYGVIASAVAGIVHAITTMLATKAGTYLLVVGAMIALAAGFTAFIGSSIDQFMVGAPPMVARGLDMLPANTDACIGAIIGARIAGWLWRRKIDAMTARPLGA